MSAYSDEVARAREARGLTLRELAHELGVSIPYIHDVEKGRRAPLDGVRSDCLALTLRIDSRRLASLAAQARGFVDVTGLEVDAVARVLRAVERERHRAAEGGR